MLPEKLKLSELVVVEGLHDAQAVREVVAGDVWVIGGDRVAHKFLSELKRASVVRGVIVLTDPDGPGERIRRRIEMAVPGVKHAFIPQRLALGKGKVGVEHASSEAIRQALLAAKPTLGESMVSSGYSIDDLLKAGLVGGREAALKRQEVGDILSIGTGNAKSFLKKLNGLGIRRDEWDEAMKQVERSKMKGDKPGD